MKKLTIFLFTLSSLFLFYSCDATIPNTDNTNYPTAKWDGTASIWLKGSGTEADPYQIETAEHLAYLAQQVNLGTTYDGIYFKLMNDLNLDGSQTKQWTPIGGYTNGVITGVFKGKFDGNNKVIYKLYINNQYADKQALFGQVGELSTIKNLGLDASCSITGKNTVAGLVAYYSTGYVVASITNCFNKGSVTAVSGSTVGGIFGYAAGAKVNACYNTGTISGKNCVAGIIGLIAQSCISEIKNCYNTGNINSTGYAVGGIVGLDYSPLSPITGCYNTGAISANSIGVSGVGGIVGEAYSAVTGCYNKGNVTSTSKTNVGGIAGYVFSTGSVGQCYNLGSISGTSDCTLGGIAGYVSPSANAGNSYYLSGCVTNSSAYGISKTATELKAAGIITLLNVYGTPFKADYSNNVNGGYPIASWQ